MPILPQRSRHLHYATAILYKFVYCLCPRKEHVIQHYNEVLLFTRTSGYPVMVHLGFDRQTLDEIGNFSLSAASFISQIF